MSNIKLYKKYLEQWDQSVLPLIKIKDFTSAEYAANRLIVQLTDELGFKKLSQRLWKLKC